ncbi:hypothetical protein [Nocardia gipuzkoensis]
MRAGFRCPYRLRRGAAERGGAERMWSRTGDSKSAESEFLSPRHFRSNQLVAGDNLSNPSRYRARTGAHIRAALDAGVGASAIARDADFSREYISRIRDGKGPATPSPDYRGEERIRPIRR